jgi:hypothetical protein
MAFFHFLLCLQVQLIQQPITAQYMHQLFSNGQGQLIMQAGMLPQAMNAPQMVIATATGKPYLQAQPQMVAGGKPVQFSGGQPGNGQPGGQATATGYSSNPGGAPGQPQTFVIAGQLNPLGVISSQPSIIQSQHQAQQRSQEMNKVCDRCSVLLRSCV